MGVGGWVRLGVGLGGVGWWGVWGWGEGVGRGRGGVGGEASGGISVNWAWDSCGWSCSFRRPHKGIPGLMSQSWQEPVTVLLP